MADDKNLTTRQAANYLGYSVSTLRMSRSTGKLASVKPPRHFKLGDHEKSPVRYRKKDLESWIANLMNS